MSFQCLPNCGKCCGKVALSAEVYVRVRHKAADHMAICDQHLRTGEPLVWAVGADDRCAFLDRKTMGCNIYEDRPPVCREFGRGDDIRIACPWVAPDGRRRRRQATRRILRETPHRLLRIE